MPAKEWINYHTQFIFKFHFSTLLSFWYFVSSSGESPLEDICQKAIVQPRKAFSVHIVFKLTFFKESIRLVAKYWLVRL